MDKFVHHLSEGTTRLVLRIQSPNGGPRRQVLLFPTVETHEDDPGTRAQIGSATSADVKVESPDAASFHASLQKSGEDILLRDRGSPGGTFINGMKCIGPTPIHRGDQLVLGRTLITIADLQHVSTGEPIPPTARKAVMSSQHLAREALERQLFDSASEWYNRGRPRRKLMRPSQVAEFQRLLGPIHKASLEESRVAEFLTASVDYGRWKQEMRWLLGGALTGALLASPAWLRTDTKATPAQDHEVAEPDEVQTVPIACALVSHQVEEKDTWELLASLYGEPADTIKQRNNALGHSRPSPGEELKICSYRVNSAPRQHWHRVKEGERWETLVRRYDVDRDELRRMNDDLDDMLVPGDIVFLRSVHIPDDSLGAPTPPSLPPEIEARPVGVHTAGSLENGTQPSESALYHLRCRAHSFGTNHTVGNLMKSIARLRKDYGGEIIIGDISGEDGGRYGKHVSHQNGQDVDIWLPIQGGKYQRRAECTHCDTDFCRPDPEKVDWDATWKLVKALTYLDTAEKNPVKDIFLDRKLHDNLRAAIARDGVRREDMRRFVQRRSGAPALVTHSSRHEKHIHVRFHCTPDDLECRD